jgi:hypothetical protein
MNIEKVKVDLQGCTANGPFPLIVPCPLDDLLLCQERSQPHQQHAITLVLHFIVDIASYNNISTKTPILGSWPPGPGPIYSQIRVALNKPAIEAIQRTNDPDVPFKLTLANVSFNDVTPKGG